MSDLLLDIRTSANSFTKTEKRVADYVLANPKDVMYMSITELADACGVGDTSVFRFCRHLKQKGYHDFKMHLAQSLSDQSNASVFDDQSPEDSLEVTVHKALEANVNALRETCDLIDCKALYTAVEWLAEAERIAFFGSGSSAVSALDAQARFMRITSKVCMSMDTHMQTFCASLLTPRDVAVLYSYSGNTKDTVSIAQTAKQAGARLICISRFRKSPLEGLCDLLLLCGANEGPMQGGSLSAKVSQLFLTEVLYLGYFKRTYEQSMHNKHLSSTAISEKLY